MTGFNAEDENNLLKLLKAILGERHFHKKYRQIADVLME